MKKSTSKNNKQTYLLLKTDATYEEIVTDGYMPLKQMQDCVGGYIEIVPLMFPHSNLFPIVNEEGRLKELPVNPFFTQLVGNILLARREDEDLAGLFKAQIDMIKELIEDVRRQTT